MGLESLSPDARTQYDALMPEIERSVRSKNQARGTFYSGQAGDEEVRAKADLLAKLAAQDTAVQATSNENAKNRAAQQELQREEIKAGKRNSLVNMLGAGMGSAATLGGLAYMNKPVTNLVPMGDGKFGIFDPVTKTISPIGTTGAAGSGGLSSLNIPPSAPGLQATLNADFGVAPGTVPGSAPPITPTAPKGQSMWTSATDFKNLGAGAIGGGAGYLASKGLGADSTAGAIGSGVGGLGAYGLYSKFGSGNPYMAGLAALGGSLGGGLLGNLFK